MPSSSSLTSQRSTEQKRASPVKALFEHSTDSNIRTPNSEKVNIANVETVLTASGSSSGSSIKENEFLLECKKDDVKMLSETNDSTKIKEHSFVSSGENNSGIDEDQKLNIKSEGGSPSDCSDLEVSLQKLGIEETSAGNEIEDKNSVTLGQKQNDIVVGNKEISTKNESAITDDVSEDKDKVNNQCKDSDKQNDMLIGANETELCEVSGKRTEDIDVTDKVESSVKTDAIPDANSGKQLASALSEHSDSSEQDNILGVYTQDDSDIKLPQTFTKSVEKVVERTDNTIADIPAHSFLNEENNTESPTEKDSEVEDIIGHSFLTDDSVLGKELDDSEEQKDLKEKDRDTVKTEGDIIATKETVKTIDKNGSESSLGSESDNELESPESSPVKRKKLERPSSPENAEYEYVFTVDSLTDGKVCACSYMQTFGALTNIFVI